MTFVARRSGLIAKGFATDKNPIVREVDPKKLAKRPQGLKSKEIGIADHGIAPGAKTEILEILSFYQTLTIQLGERTITLGFQAARFVFAEKP